MIRSGSFETLFSIELSMVIVRIPYKLPSEANLSDHWTKKMKRKKKLQGLLLAYLPDLKQIKLPCEIILTRISPRSLDYDNLVYAFKPCLDKVCSLLIPGLAPGRADGDPRIKNIIYKQEKGNKKEYAIKIEINSI